MPQKLVGKTIEHIPAFIGKPAVKPPQSGFKIGELGSAGNPLPDGNTDVNCAGLGISSIAEDSAGFPHLCYYSQEHLNATGVLKYRKWSETAWDEEIVDDELSGKEDVSIAIDADDAPTVCIREGPI